MSFQFGAQPAGTSLFGQTPAFGAQQPFSTAAPTTAAPQFGSTFGAAAQPTGLQFGNTPTSSLFGQTQPGAFSLGAAASTTGNAFGSAFGDAASAPNTGLGGFGAGVASPSFGAGTATSGFGTGLTFGTPTTSVPAFGNPVSSAPSFGFGNNLGTPTAAPNTGLPFGTSITPSSGLTFGTPASTGLTFGASPAPAPVVGSAFGNASLPVSTGLSFGAPTTTTGSFGATPAFGFGNTSTSAAPALPFGAATTAAQSTGFTLGATTSAPNFSLGTSNNTQLRSTPASTNLGFGATASTGISFTPQTSITATVAPTTALAFNTPASTGLQLGTTSAPLGFGAKTTGPLTFGTPTLATIPNATASTATGLAFGSPFTSTITSTTATITPFSGLGITTTSTAIPSLGLGGIPTTKTTLGAPQQIGLGGIPTTTTATASTTFQGELLPKDQPLPNELLQTVEAFKAFLKEQKTNSSEILRFSMKELKNVECNITGVNSTINDLENDLQKQKCLAEKLKLDSAQALQDAEMAQRTFEIPAGMQYDNTAPINFFVNLLQDFERDLQQLRFQLECVNKRVKNGNAVTGLTPEDLALGLRRLHQTFSTLAIRLQTVHNQVEIQKERYLNLRKSVLNDSTNVFESQNKDLEALEYTLRSIANDSPQVVAGPSPFNALGTSQVQVLAQNPPPAYPGTSLAQFPTDTQPLMGLNTNPFFGSFGNTSSLFNSPTGNSFQLQKPPTGSKRGKT